MSLHQPIRRLDCFNVQKVLPAVYDDSLSYYELLTKVLHQINEVTDGYNSVYDAMVVLQAAWEEFEQGGYLESFEEFIHNWFDDNQDEINQMLTEGFGGEIERLDTKILTTKTETLEEVADDYVPFPITPLSKYGTTGQLLSTHADGDTEWVDPVIVTSEVAGPLIDAWLTLHPEATTTVQDGSITDAKLATSSTVLRNRGWVSSYPDYHSCDDIVTNGIYYVSSSGGTTRPSDFPFNAIGVLVVCSNGTLTMQLAYSTVTALNASIKMRIKASASAEWGAWHEYRNGEYDDDALATAIAPLGNFRRLVAPSSSCDQLTKNGVYFVSSTGGTLHATDYPFDHQGWLFVSDINDNLSLQIAYASDDGMKMRTKNAGTWGEWFIPNQTHYDGRYLQSRLRLGDATSCDDFVGNGVHFITSSGGVTNPPDYPLGTAGWLLSFVFGGNTNLRLQIALPLGSETIHPVFRTRSNNGVWTSWRSTNETITTTITREVSNDTYNNTYNITTTPTITTDTNGWLQAVDDESTAEQDATDMTAAIMTMLNSTGYCKLSEGTFYVSGNIDIPIGATLEGCGYKTIVRLLSSETSAYIARIKQYATVRDIRFSGSKSAIDVSSGNIGGREGIRYIGNRNGQHPEVTPSAGKVSIIDGCWFDNLDSGIYGYNSGGGLQEGLMVTNCYIYNCNAGINLDYWVEYCKFTNVVMYHCHYACINNGGNNVFVACTFHGTIGFLIDNSGDNKPNAAHGSVIGCTFNHIDNWNHPDTLGGGLAIQVLNVINGFIFTGCQFFYSEINVQNSKGIQVSNSLFNGGSNSKLTVSGSYPVIFSDDVFLNNPVMEVPTNTIFDNCRNAQTGNLIGV